VALRLRQIHFGDALFQRATEKLYTEDVVLVEAGLAVALVGQPAEEHEQRRVDDRVAVQDPGQRAQAGLVQVPGDLRQGHVDDEQVEAGHHHAGTHDQQDLAGPQRPGRGTIRSLA